MAITSRRTGLIKNPITPAPPRSGMIYMLDAGAGVTESHRGLSTANAVMGRALNSVGNRAAARILPQTTNTRRSI